MELTEAIESINKQLSDLYGIDTVTGQAMFRVVWSDDQFEKRLSKFTPEGFELLYPAETIWPKYRQYIKERYILERLVQVPPHQQIELLGLKISYEPLWTFQTEQGVYLPPRLDACQFVIDSVYAAEGKQSMRAKYVNPEDGNPVEAKMERVDKIQKELFGNETDTTDALAHGQGIVVPTNYEKGTVH